MAYQKLSYRDFTREKLVETDPNAPKKPPRGVHINKSNTWLKSKEERERHAKIAAECGLTPDLKPISKPRPVYADAINDPVYLQDQLGDTTNLSWEEL